jgi:signal transduction histidine kinase
MGIWGNVTLVRMQLAGSRRGEKRALALETTIQNGAHFIQLILGYVAERRISTKRIRLKHLSEEIFQNKHIVDAFDLNPLWAPLKSADSAFSPAWVAGILVYFLDRFLKKIAPECHAIAAYAKQAQSRVEKIELLMQRGSSILKQLRLFAGELQPKAGRVRLNQLLRKQAQKTLHEHRGLVLELQLEPKLPEVWADREQLQWMLQQVIDNAVSMMHPDAQLALCASYPALKSDRRNSADKPQQGAGVLITIKETRNMEKSNQVETRERFSYTVMRGQYIGLPLAAAGSIARKHGGDLQVRSDPHGCRLCTIVWPAVATKKANDLMPAMAETA